MIECTHNPPGLSPIVVDELADTLTGQTLAAMTLTAHRLAEAAGTSPVGQGWHLIADALD